MKKRYKILLLILLFRSAINCQIEIELTKQLNQISSIQTEYERYFEKTITKSTIIEKFDNKGRLINITISKDDSDKTERYFFYELNSTTKTKTIDISSKNRLMVNYDTLIYRYSYDNNSNLTNEVVSNTKDSIIWIKNIVYNSKGDKILSSYYKTPKWILDGIPEYCKDSTYYDYSKNIVKSYILANNGEHLTSSIAEINPNLTKVKYDKFNNIIENEKFIINYEYDERGNWISKISYVKNGTEKKISHSKKRVINYID